MAKKKVKPPVICDICEQEVGEENLLKYEGKHKAHQSCYVDRYCSIRKKPIPVPVGPTNVAS